MPNIFKKRKDRLKTQQLKCLEEAIKKGFIHRHPEKMEIGYCEGESVTLLTDAVSDIRMCDKCIGCPYFSDNVDVERPKLLLSIEKLKNIDYFEDVPPTYEDHEYSNVMRLEPK